MQLSKITKINVESFVEEMNLYDPSNFINNCESIGCCKIYDINKIYLGFVVNDEEENKNINIIFKRENIAKLEFLNCIKYLRISIKHKNKLYLTVFDEKLLKMVENEFNVLETNNEIGYKVFDIS